MTLNVLIMNLLTLIGDQDAVWASQKSSTYRKSKTRDIVTSNIGFRGKPLKNQDRLAKVCNWERKWKSSGTSDSESIFLSYFGTRRIETKQ